jgi:hypothetical protein
MPGPKLEYVCGETGERINVSLFAGTLPYSQYPSPSRKAGVIFVFCVAMTDLNIAIDIITLLC